MSYHTFESTNKRNVNLTLNFLHSLIFFFWRCFFLDFPVYSIIARVLFRCDGPETYSVCCEKQEPADSPIPGSCKPTLTPPDRESGCCGVGINEPNRISGRYFSLLTKVCRGGNPKSNLDIVPMLHVVPVHWAVFFFLICDMVTYLNA